MKSYVVYEDQSCKIVDNMPMPKYGDYDALVKIESCGFATEQILKSFTENSRV